ncbi:TatD family hydrolase [Candidatus Saccharibacteria bacterium]|nr:TatD family hydrolase [Candidatus Saccharibacteria bacterium]
MLIDSHCHLHDRQFFSEEQAETMLMNAQKNGVEKIVCIGTDPLDSLAARDFAAAHKNVYWTYGVHPEETTKAGGVDFVLPKEHLPVAIGEVGLDYHSEGYFRDAQIRLFEEMLQLAMDNDLPLSFHVRNAFSDFFAVIENFPNVRGVVHSFTDSKKVLKRILETTDFYVGVNGLATYSTLPTPPLERILLETDAPFLTPVPFRGIINEPAYIRNIAEWLSEKLGEDFAKIEQETTRNVENLFRI